MNELRLQAKLVSKTALRYTPAGIEAIECDLMHQGEVEECGHKREIAVVVPTIAFGLPALQLHKQSLGDQITVAGFIAAKQQKSKQLVFHLLNFL